MTDQVREDLIGKWSLKKPDRKLFKAPMDFPENP